MTKQHLCVSMVRQQLKSRLHKKSSHREEGRMGKDGGLLAMSAWLLIF